MESFRWHYRPVVANCGTILQSLLVVIWLCGAGILGSSDHAREQDCLQLFDTPSQGVYVCREHIDLVVALQIAEEMGREECERAFQQERWNCSNFSILKAPNITKMATKEAAYVHALSLAAIAHSVAKMCAVGEVTSCSCDAERLELPTGDTEKQYTRGCSDNVGFGINFATQFLKLRLSNDTGSVEEEIATDRREVFLHNLRIAAEVVREKTSVSTMPCKCLGVSATCSILSCPQQKLSKFSLLAEEILRIYGNHTSRHLNTGDTSTHEHGNSSAEANGRVFPEISATSQVQLDGPPTGEKNFLFLDDSPDYCIRDMLVGSLGTVGRECDPHTTGPNSCANLCTACGRSYANVTESVEETCSCSFSYCCEIHCHKCLRTRYVTVCA